MIATAAPVASEKATGTLDVLIIHHPTTNEHRPIPIPAIGLLSMADLLDRNGIRAQVVNLRIEKKVVPDFDVVEYAAASGVRVVGLSIHWFFQLPDCLDLARQFKDRHPDILVVLGGFAASVFGRDLLAEHPYVDAVIRGDGEVPFLQLCREVLDRDDGAAFDTVSNLIYRDRDATVRETAFSHIMYPKLFGELRFTNMKLLKNQEADLRSPVHMACKKFRDRLDFTNKGLLFFGPTRGCAFMCPLCGGNRNSQKLAFNRERLLYQPIDGAIANIREAMRFGYGNFYLCSDPNPHGDYYLDLFRRIRQERLRINFIFESWSLPSETFVESFRDTFEEGIIVISPDSGNEEVRRRTKGPLAYSNHDLRARLQSMWDKDLMTHVFFGFFLPGDTPETVRETRRMTYEFENDNSEVFYLAFSTDPYSPVHQDPDAYGMVIKFRTLREYLEALPQQRTSSNLIGHRPASMSEDMAQSLVLTIDMDQFVRKILPLSIRMLRSIASVAGQFHELHEKLLETLGAGAKKSEAMPSCSQVIEEMSVLASAGGGSAPWRALADLARFEGWPFVLMERHFGGLGRHYSSTCNELELSGEKLTEFMAGENVVTSHGKFDFDVIGLTADIRMNQPVRVSAQETILTMAIDRNANYIALKDLK